LNKVVDLTSAFSPLGEIAHIANCGYSRIKDCDKFVLYLKKNGFEEQNSKYVEMAVSNQLKNKNVEFLKLYKIHFPKEFEKVIE
jgi:diketogulonate reductase-like aldo/keto reductase